MESVRKGTIATSSDILRTLTLIWQDENYHVHIFKNPEQLVYHGKMIMAALFKHRSIYITPPDARLITWHYRQCVIKRFRAFSMSRQDLDLRAA